jgi:hypothetical protein
MSRSARIGITVVLLAVAGGATAALWPEPDEPEEPEVAEDKDTGMSRFQTEELMRTIGYVQ